MTDNLTIHTITIKNCNCIKSADIILKEKTLNIKYGLNGTGKSTLGFAIQAKSKNSTEELLKLLPYGHNTVNEGETPFVSELPFEKICVFNEKNVEKYMFKENDFFENSFDVFLKSDECNNLERQISTMLSELQDGFQSNNDLQDLQQLLPILFQTLKIKDDNVAKVGGVKEFIEGNGCGFEKQPLIASYSPFYNQRDFSKVVKWTKWRTDGIPIMNGKNCPFCVHEMDIPIIEQQNTVIKKVFKNAAVQTANAVLTFLENAVKKDYISQDCINELNEYIGDNAKTNELATFINQLALETEYLNNQIIKILLFKPMNVDREHINNMEIKLNELTISETLLTKFYCTTHLKSIIQIINDKISNLKTQTGFLKGLFFRYDTKLKELIETRKDDINNFLTLAGFPYNFNIQPDGNNKAITYLQPIGYCNERVKSPSERLSWGEKNAFSLVMFMFEAISENADLIVLDDPISAFDTNKKFAIIRRLFDNQLPSFKERTVLMLTHDSQPLIDYVKENMFTKYGIITNVEANYLSNQNGIIQEALIDQFDLKNVITFMKEIIHNPSSTMAERIVNLRKYIELSVPQYSSLPIYHVLSNIIHGRIEATYGDEAETKLETQVFIDGCIEISSYIENFDYNSAIEELSDANLIQLYNIECDYIKIIVARLLFERKKGMLRQLRKKFPGLCKYVNESNHVENDYIFQLDPKKFLSIPSCYMTDLNDFINKNILHAKIIL